MHAQETIDPQDPLALFVDAVLEPVKAPVGLGLMQFHKLVDDFCIFSTAPVVQPRTAEADYRTVPFH